MPTGSVDYCSSSEPWPKAPADFEEDYYDPAWLSPVGDPAQLSLF